MQILLLLVMLCSSLSFAQKTHLKKYSNHSFLIDEYLVPDYKSKSYQDFIRMDSLISISIYGNGTKFFFYYNDRNKISELLISENSGSGWGNSLRNNLIYDSLNRLKQEINLGWHVNKWDTLSRINYSYESGLLVNEVFQIYENMTWLNSTRGNYVYDTSQTLSHYFVEKWTNNNWYNWFLSTYYSSLPSRVDSILFQTWSNDEWQKDKKTNFFYSGNQIDLDSLVVSLWDGLSWSSFLKREVIIDANHNTIEQIDKTWNGYSWLNEIRRFFSYNAFNFIELVYCDIWDNNEWIRGDGDIFFHYENGFTVSLFTNSVSAYYSQTTDVDKEETLGIRNYSLSQNYPNPFNPITKIEFSIPSTDNVELKVFNLLGVEISTLLNKQMPAGRYILEFNADGLPSGIYLYRVVSGKFAVSKKMVLLR